MRKEKVAIIGGGLSGLVSAYLLSKHYDITLFDAKTYLGGHSYTHYIHENETDIEIDLGFMLFNPKGYPNFVKLLKSLEVPLHKSDLSFSFSSRDLIEYKGPQLGNPFTPKRNLLSKRSYKLFLEIRRFNAIAYEVLAQNQKDIPLTEFIQEHHFNDLLINAYLFPTLNTLLSLPHDQLDHVSTNFALGYLGKNGLLENFFKPPWYFLKGGAKAYLEPLCEPFKQHIRLKSNIETIERDKYHITVHTKEAPIVFDKLVLAMRADQALNVLLNPSPLEQRILGSFEYNDRNIFLHTDKSMMPTNTELWAGLNYRNHDHPILTYHANKVQDFHSKLGYFITMCEGKPVANSKVIKETKLYRPFASIAATENQKRYDEVNGLLNTYYCGSYWGFGTHEDAVLSAFDACRPLLKDLI